MFTLFVAVGSFVGFIVAYHTYGRWLGGRIFGLDDRAEVPSKQLRDNVDFVPTQRQVIFGHHFTSIAGTGPIVGPAIAVFWGWLPALLWVVLGSIFIGAVHDFGALVVSLRNRGQTVGQIAGRMITPRARVLFLLILFFALTIVLAVFGLVIATIFKLYPESVLSVWVAMPLAVVIGLWVYRWGGGLLVPSLVALALLYVAVYLGAYWWPVRLTDYLDLAAIHPRLNETVVWTVILFAYCFLASVLPVWILLQPRDYINSHQLLVALGLLLVGLLFAGATGRADMHSAPALLSKTAADAPPILPFLFITIACGAVSGFHCLVSSGTSSKQISKETDAQYVGYGAMLLEGALAVIVIIACTAGVGMGKYARSSNAAAAGGYEYAQVLEVDGTHRTGRAAWDARYNITAGWGAFQGLGPTVGAFVEGGGNILSSIGVPLKMSIAIVAVLVACFAATTLDTATRLQRYVVQELAGTFRITPLTNKYAATGFAVVLAGAVAMLPSKAGGELGTGGMILWPLFGATNQLLAGLAFLVTVFYLWRRKKAVWFVVIPMIMMLVFPAWAMLWNLFNARTGWLVGQQPNYLLAAFGVAIMVLQVWMVIEAILTWPRARGVLEEALPPLEKRPVQRAAHSVSALIGE